MRQLMAVIVLQTLRVRPRAFTRWAPGGFLCVDTPHGQLTGHCQVVSTDQADVVWIRVCFHGNMVADSELHETTQLTAPNLLLQ